jgi:glycosyltransferase involved in cell wall biosynthesis
MHVLHVTAHLGGGVGKAHAALRAAMPADISQTYLLLEQPRDRRYADEIAAAGGEIVFARDLDHVARLCGGADIVQFEFWNHPKLFECLARTDFPAMRSVFWSHISGLFKPVIAPGLFSMADRFVFTTPASMGLGQELPHDQRSRLSAIGSGFGFQNLPPLLGLPPSALPGISPSRGENGWEHSSRPLVSRTIGASGSRESLSPLEGEMPGRAEGGELHPPAHPITYLGTVDFIKMHPGLFDAVDALSHDVEAAIWGGYDPAGDVAAKARAMHHPNRIRFMGQTADPQAALEKSSIFFYPLQPDHYGTAENALIEAMSLGLLPVVLANPAECAIVENGITGFIAGSIDECSRILDRLLDEPQEAAKIAANAAHTAREKYTAKRSADAFVALWQSLIKEPKHSHDFASVTGRTPLDWYHATQFLPGEKIAVVDASDKQSKGTLAHFRSAFADDPCWNAP